MSFSRPETHAALVIFSYYCLMVDELEKLVQQAESDISQRGKATRKKARNVPQLPKFSLAIGIWLVAILLAAFQFDTVKSLVTTPAESKIEEDLSGILTTAANSLRSYQINTGSLPALLPNPAIRGLVNYERATDDDFILTATIHNVTMVMDSTQTRSYREKAEQN